MLEKICLASIEEWIQSCEGAVPIDVVTDHPQRQSLESLIDSYPSLRGRRIEAVLGLRIGSIDRAHEIVQHGGDSMDRYLHGVIHRIEGDFWNAKYWFRQVDDRELLALVGKEVLLKLQSLQLVNSSSSLRLFDDRNRFSAQNFVDAQAALPNNASAKELTLIREIAQAEWDALWKIVKHQEPEA
jgi:hypothetical protein